MSDYDRMSDDGIYEEMTSSDDLQRDANVNLRESYESSGKDSPEKKVKFDEQNLMSTQKKQGSGDLIGKIRLEVAKLGRENKTPERNKALKEYTQLAIKSAASVDAKTNLKKAIDVLQDCVFMIQHQASKSEAFNDLQLEAYQAMADCYIRNGSLQKGLDYLLLSKKYLENIEKIQPTGAVTESAELYLNISNVMTMLVRVDESKDYFEKALSSGTKCLKYYESMSAKGSLKPDEACRLIDSVRSVMKCNQLSGQQLYSQKQFANAIKSYEDALNIGFKYLNPNDQIMKDLKIQLDQAKTSNMASNISAKTDTPPKKSMEQSKLNSSLGKTKIHKSNAMGKDLAVVATPESAVKKIKTSAPASKPKPARPSSAVTKSPSAPRITKSTAMATTIKTTTTKQDFNQSKMSLAATTQASAITVVPTQPNSAKRKLRPMSAVNRNIVKKIKPAEQTTSDSKAVNKMKTTRPTSSESRIDKKVKLTRPTSSKPKVLKKSTSLKKPMKEEDFAKLKLRMEMKLRAKQMAQTNSQAHEVNLARFHLGHPSVENKCFFFNRNRRCNDDLWRIDHNYKVERHGPIGYHQSRFPRPKRLFFFHRDQNLQSQSSRRRKSSKVSKIDRKSTKTIVNIITEPEFQQHDDEFDSKHLLAELDLLRKEVLDPDMSDLEDQIKVMERHYSQQQKELVRSITLQREIATNQFHKEQERVRSERRYREEMFRRNRSNSCCSQQAQPDQSIPPVHPLYGPGVFDYHNGCWTFPYAKWFNPNLCQSELLVQPSSESDIEEYEPESPRPQTVDNAMQTDYVFQKERCDQIIQTKIVKENVIEKAIGTDSPPKRPKKQPKLKIMTLEEAAKKIQAVARARAKRRRETEFRVKVDEYPVLSWSLDHCYLTGNIDIMVVHALQDDDKMCWAVRFTIFDYVSKQVKFQYLCDKILNVEQFSGFALRNICFDQLRRIGWESPPFPNHVRLLQEIINQNLGDASNLNQAATEKKQQKIKQFNKKVKPNKQHLSKIEFKIYSKSETDNNSYRCRIQKRVRPSQGKASKLIHDWQIHVTQVQEPKSTDYLVLRRLPVQLSEMQEYLDSNLDWKLNKRVIPFSILYLELRVPLGTREIIVRSRKFYDLSDFSRFNIRFHNSLFFNFNQVNQAKIEQKEDQVKELLESFHLSGKTEERQQKLQRLQDDLNDLKERDVKLPPNEDEESSFFELLIQDLFPKKTNFKLQKGYRTRDYLQRKERMIKKTKPWYQGNVSDVDSDSEDHDDKDYFKDIECFFDEDELMRIQLDEVNIKREYVRLTCLKIPSRFIDDNILIDKDNMLGPHSDIAFQYYMENICVKIVSKGENEADQDKAFIGLRIRNQQDRFKSDEVWKRWLNDEAERERFMSQSIIRYRDKQFAVSVYQMPGVNEDQNLNTLEAVNIDSPTERTYLQFKNTCGLRGLFLKQFIESQIKIILNQDDKIERIALAIAPEQFLAKMASVKNVVDFTPEEPLPAGFSPSKYRDEKVAQIYVMNCTHVKKQKRRKSRSNSSSDSDLDKQEKKEIKQDIKDLKRMLKLIRKKANEVPNGLRGWFDYFDRDGSDEIELMEFVNMIRYLKIELTDRFGIMLFRLFDREDIGCFNFATMHDILEKLMKPYYKVIVRKERERFRKYGLDIKWPPRQKKQQIVIVEKEPKTVIKEFIKEVPVYIDRPVYVKKETPPKKQEPPPEPKPVIKPPEPKPVVKQPEPKPVEVVKPPDTKPVVKQPEPKPVEVVKPPEPKPVVKQPEPKPVEVMKPVVVVQPIPPKPVEPVKQPEIPVIEENYDDDFPVEQFDVVEEPKTPEQTDASEMKLQCNGVFEVNEATVMYEIQSGKVKDYYFSMQIKALHQNFRVVKRVLFSDEYEEAARERLRKQSKPNPTPKVLANELREAFDKDMRQLTARIVDQKKQPEQWLEQFKQEIMAQFAHPHQKLD